MLFGHDSFSDIQQIWNDFWEEKNKKPLYAITIPKDGKEIMMQPPYLSWFNGDYQKAADSLARWYESCEFYGCAIPCFSISFGADDFAALIGCDLNYRPYDDGSGSGTSWTLPILDNLESINIHFNPNGKWWNNISAFHRILKQRLGDTVMIAPPTLSAGLDALSALYSPQSLLMDLIDVPELVHNALDQINNSYTEIVKACEDLFEIKKYGTVNRHGAYSSKFTTVLQCDFSCMISPELFEEFAMLSLQHEFTLVHGSEYHLDGPDALKHLERLLQIPELDLIQWVPGAGFGEKQDWTDLYKHILKSGKGLILGTNAANIKIFLEKFQSKKMFIPVHGIKSRMEAEDFLAKFS